MGPGYVLDYAKRSALGKHGSFFKPHFLSMKLCPVV